MLMGMAKPMRSASARMARIGLDEVVIARVVSQLNVFARPIFCGHDARGHGMGQAERVADRNHPVADTGSIRITQREPRKVGFFYFEHGNVGRCIAADHLCFHFPGLAENHAYLAGPFDHVVVRQYESILIEDEGAARAGADHGTVPRMSPLHRLHEHYGRVGRRSQIRKARRRIGNGDHGRWRPTRQRGRNRRWRAALGGGPTKETDPFTGKQAGPQHEQPGHQRCLSRAHRRFETST